MKFPKIKHKHRYNTINCNYESQFSYLVKADISKAFPDMSNIFENVAFYNQDGELVSFKGYKDKVLLVFLATRIVLMSALLQF